VPKKRITKREAKAVVGKQRRTDLVNMAKALSLVTWQNTPEDWRRLEAAVVLLGDEAPPRARALIRLRRQMGITRRL
jgi:hypothetical protein